MPTPIGLGLKVAAYWLVGMLAMPTGLSLHPSIGQVVTLREETKQAFHAYVASTEAKNDKNLAGPNFLWIDDAKEPEKSTAYEKLKHGEVLLRRNTGSSGSGEIPGGLIHDWQGLIFIPGAKLDNALAVLQDYDHHANYFAPDVEQSKIEEHSGNHYRVYLRFKRKSIVVVVFNTEHEVNYFRDSLTRVRSRSSAVRIAEVDNPGEASEKEKTPGQDGGFLWRMETWWRIEEKDGGVYVQNQVVSLTRDIPTGLGWAVEPFITSIPKESLEFTLTSVRRAALARAKAKPASDSQSK